MPRCCPPGGYCATHHSLAERAGVTVTPVLGHPSCRVWLPVETAQDETPITVIPSDIPATLPKNTTEATLRSWIRKVAKPYGWQHFHVYNSERSEAGFPDDVLTDGTSLLMYELKMNGRKPSEAQQKWLSLLAHTGKVECGVWTPSMWSEIYERLTRKERL